MAYRDAASLTVTSDAPLCTFEAGTVAVQIEPGHVVVEEGGFAVVGPDQGPPIAARSFRLLSNVGDAPAEWLEARLEDYHVNNYQEYHLPAGTLGDRCSRGVNVAFTMLFDHVACTVTVVVRIHVKDGRASARRGWRRAIIEAWSGHYALFATSGRPPCSSYAIRFEIRWVGAGEEWDYEVQATSGCGRSSMRFWNMDDPYQMAAHEFGHMLGNIDEYDGTDDGCPDRPVREGIMNNESRWRVAAPRHYYLIKRFAEESLCAEFDVRDRRRVVGLSAGDDLDPSRLGHLDEAIDSLCVVVSLGFGA